MEVLALVDDGDDVVDEAVEADQGLERLDTRGRGGEPFGGEFTGLFARRGEGHVKGPMSEVNGAGDATRALALHLGDAGDLLVLVVGERVVDRVRRGEGLAVVLDRRPRGRDEHPE